jgi:hypothetical protein
MGGSEHSFLWPELRDYDSAATAMTTGAVAAALTSFTTACFAIAAISAGHPIYGFSAWAFVDAVVFGVVSWRMFHQSLPWAIAGLILFIVARAIMIFETGFQIPVVAMGFVLLVSYFHAVRAGFKISEIRDLARNSPKSDRTAI